MPRKPQYENRCIYFKNSRRCKNSVWSEDKHFCRTHSPIKNLHIKDNSQAGRKIIYLDQLLDETYTLDYGICMECGQMCNYQSQWCGRCARGGVH